MPLRSRTLIPAAVAVALAVVLTGCVPEPAPGGPSTTPSASVPSTPAVTPTASPTTTPTPSATPTATPTPTVSPTAEPTTPPDAGPGAVLPSCDDTLPLSTVHALFGDAAEPIDAGGSAADHMPGPVAAETARGAAQTRVCTWAIPFSDGGFNVITAEVSSAARDRLTASLRSASTYRSTRVDGATAFTHESDSELGTTAVVYVFVDRVWITVSGTLTVETAREFAASAVDAVRSAN